MRHLRVPVGYQGQGAKTPLSEKAEQCRIISAGQEVLNSGRQLGHQGRQLIDPLAGDSQNLGGLGVGPDRLVLEDPEKLETFQDGVLELLAILILPPLAGGDLGNRGQFPGFVAPDKKTPLFVGPCVVRSYFPGGLDRICADQVTTGEPTLSQPKPVQQQAWVYFAPSPYF